MTEQIQSSMYRSGKIYAKRFNVPVFQLLEVVDFYRGLILDAVEQEIGRSDNWTFVRARLLKALGDHGLVGRIRQILTTEFGNV
jgi:hypothetical protein